MKFKSIAILGLLMAMLTACSVAPENSTLSADSDRKRVLAIFSDLDDRTLSSDDQLENYADDAVILVPEQKEIRGHDEIRQHLEQFGNGIELTTKYEIVELTLYPQLVVAQGQVTGEAKQDSDPNVYRFATKNLILLRRGNDGRLKIWKVIYNAAPVNDPPKEQE